MSKTYTSEKLLRELPRPLLNFLWYLWEAYNNPEEPEFHIVLRSTANGKEQHIAVPSAGIAVDQDFGCPVNADIAVRKCGTRVFMEYA